MPGRGALFRASRGVLLLILGIIYAGFMAYGKVAPLLLNASYLAIAGCIAVCLFFDWSVSRNARSVAPYLLFATFYFVWALMVRPEAFIWVEGFKNYIKTLLVFGAMAIAVERWTLTTFARFVQLATIGNSAICVWEAVDPSVVMMIAQTREEGTTAFNVLRPAGLWSNPDEAAFAFVFSLLIARWAGRTLGLVGVVASLTGLFLGASRTGFALVVFCGAGYALLWLRENRVTSARLAALTGGLMLAGVVATLVAIQLDLANSWQVQRMLDFTESSRGVHAESRVEIAEAAVKLALEGSWHGHGLYAFGGGENPSIVEIGAHNIYLVIWGEAGPLTAVLYVFVLGVGIWSLFRTPMQPGDQLTLSLMWFCFLVIGLTWHNQFNSFMGMLYNAILWHLPSVLRIPDESPGAAEGEPAVP